METQAQTFERASAMLAPTWHFLRMNDTDVEVPDGLVIRPRIEVSVPWAARAARDEFENALADAQEAWERTHPAPTDDELAALEEAMAAEADATYGGTAQSAYQANADALEAARSLPMAFETGCGSEVAAYLRYAAGDRVVVESEPDKQVDVRVVVEGEPGAFSVAAVDVVADANSTVNLSIVVDGGGQTAPAADSVGFAGTTVRVFADEGAQVNVARVQTLGDELVDIDDMGLFLADGATVNVSQTVLGAGQTFTGLAADLRGEEARANIATRYLGRGSQKRDFNYIVRHHGERTECNLDANGVLAGTSSKTLRGTIDLIRGCKGAQGTENESVLLVDEGVRNKTVPVILCNEDDVAGNHGATIGHVRAEQLFYLESRGLSQQAAEGMFVGALVEQAAIDAVNDRARASVVRFGDTVVPGFSELFEED